MSTIMNCDVVVVGGGHAAIEAALACARLGLHTVMITLDLTKIGQMSCNPSVGGTAKGQIVKEIDALGGEMAKTTDKAGIQFRILNKGKGPAVWAPRAQCDRTMYRTLMTQTVMSQPNLEIKQGEAASLEVENGRVYGIVTAEGELYRCHAVIIATGTFLNGKLYQGLETFEGGRMDEAPAVRLTHSLNNLGFQVGRLKTGTPMRLDSRTIDYSKCKMQPGDEPPIPFSYTTTSLPQKQLPCWLTYTNAETHRIIKNNLDRSPLYCGLIKSTGVRYCPSIEDKVVRFPHHERHQIFIEPEGYDTHEVYVNGLFTSLPKDVQEDVVHSIPGLENAEFIRYGYAVEYDWCPPTQLKPTLETKHIEGLYFAGQINGTTGYEEAASQGLIAGINACMALKHEPPLVLGRDEAYIGVMIDDLVTKGTDEPYRMLTSRAEYRLHLRWDNADLRLMDYGRRVGLIPEELHEKFCKYRHMIQQRDFSVILSASEESRRLPFLTIGDSSASPQNDNLCGQKVPENISPWTLEQVAHQIDINEKYEGYFRQQEKQIAKFRKMEACHIPEDFDYNTVKSLLSESRQKLIKVKPSSLGQASRIPGVTPADISIIMVYLHRLQRASETPTPVTYPLKQAEKS